MEDLIFLDTHVVVWLYMGDLDLFSLKAREDLCASELFISPIVALEIQYLQEIERITAGAEEVIEELKGTVGLKLSDIPFDRVVAASLSNSWTRDPFDRIITAQAALGQDRLLTKDRTIRDHYQHAYWV
jgi:PIN domain nuclease of toxin-antitoxin system